MSDERITRFLAEMVMGWHEARSPGGWQNWYSSERLKHLVCMWLPLKYISDATEVQDHLVARGFSVQITGRTNMQGEIEYTCDIWNRDASKHGVATEETEPMAVSMAAYRALGGTE